jgi:hypothetical protein
MQTDAVPQHMRDTSIGTTGSVGGRHATSIQTTSTLPTVITSVMVVVAFGGARYK